MIRGQPMVAAKAHSLIDKRLSPETPLFVQGIGKNAFRQVIRPGEHTARIRGRRWTQNAQAACENVLVLLKTQVFTGAPPGTRTRIRGLRPRIIREFSGVTPCEVARVSRALIFIATRLQPHESLKRLWWQVPEPFLKAQEAPYHEIGVTHARTT